MSDNHKKLEAENAQLKVNQEKLEAEIVQLKEALEAAKPKPAAVVRHGEGEEKYHFILIKSNGLDTINGKKNPLTGDRDKFKYVKITINGKSVEVLCDQQIEVSNSIYEAVKPLLDSQRGLVYTG